MTRKILEFQGILLLTLVILFGAHFLWNQVFAAPEKTLSGTVQNGELRELQDIVVSEQTNHFAEFATFKETSGLAGTLRWLMPGDSVGTATIFFKWQARALYGVRITKQSPIEWQRVPASPGVIEIVAPPLSVIEVTVGLGKDELMARNVKNSAFVNESAKKFDYLPQLQLQSEAQAAKTLASERLQDLAARVIGDHVMSIINQGAPDGDKIHSAVVKFRLLQTPQTS